MKPLASLYGSDLQTRTPFPENQLEDFRPVPYGSLVLRKIVGISISRLCHAWSNDEIG